MNKYLSKKEYLKKYDSNVGYALYVQDNIKKDDYVRLNTGEIVKVTGIKENKLNKKAIYFGIYEQDWFDSMAVENFSDKPIDLIEVGDLIKTNEEKTIIHIYDNDTLEAVKEDIEEGHFTIESIVTHEQFASIEYKVEENEEYD